jgi:3-oxoacyl-[acyl-carrier protein] reductase
VHIWINNTGGPAPGAIREARLDAFTAAFNHHVVASQTLAQLLLPGMRAAGYGRIINILSTSVKEPIRGLGVSNTIRWAIAAWAKTLATEIASEGITVNNVLPGYTQTPRLESLISGRTGPGKDAEAVAHDLRATIPAGRFAAPEEIANAVAFLASPAAAYITGINLPVDGGRTSSL